MFALVFTLSAVSSEAEAEHFKVKMLCHAQTKQPLCLERYLLIDWTARVTDVLREKNQCKFK